MVLDESRRQEVIELLSKEVVERELRERKGLRASGSKHREALAEGLRRKLINGAGTLTLEERELLDHYLNDMVGV